MGTTFIIVPFVDVTQPMIDVSAETSFSTLRHSTRGEDRVILKWNGDTPELLKGYTQYSHSEILDIIVTDDWNGSVEEDSSSSE